MAIDRMAADGRHILASASTRGAQVGRHIAAAADDVHDAGDRLAQRVEDIRVDLGELARALEEIAEERLGPAKDLLVEGMRQGGRALRATRRSVNSAGASVRADPVPLIVGVAVVLLVGSLFAGREGSRRR